MGEKVLWFLLLLLAVFSSAELCSHRTIPGDVEEYNIRNFTVDDGCSCNGGCVRKCCADGFGVLMLEKKCSRSVFNGSFIIRVNGAKILDYFTGFMTCDAYFLEPDKYEDDAFVLQEDGRLWLKETNVYKNVNEFCVDYTDVGGYIVFVCFPVERIKERLFRQFKEISKCFK